MNFVDEVVNNQKNKEIDLLKKQIILDILDSTNDEDIRRLIANHKFSIKELEWIKNQLLKTA